MSRLAHSSDDATMDAIERQAHATEDKESRAMAEAEDRSEAQAAAPSGLELVVSKALNPAQVFTTNGLEPILERIEKETRSIALDISTPKGRKDIASLAHKIAKSKTALDNAGKELVAGWKERAKKVDLERSRAWDRLEALQKEIRQPLTEWEDREKNRVATHEANLAEITGAGAFTAANWQALSVEVMTDRLNEIKQDKFDWQEFAARAKLATETAIATISAALEKRQKHDTEQAELARLRKEEEERKQREHEQRIAADAAEKARLAAEEKARKAAEAQAARVSAEIAQAEQARLRIQREKDAADAKAKRDAEEAAAREARAKKDKEDAEARAAQAEAARLAAEKKAKEDARIAAEKTVADRKAAEDAAALRERQRIQDEQRAEKEAAVKREADKAHKAKINNEALDAIAAEISIARLDFDQTMCMEAAKQIVQAIAVGTIPHIKISY